MEKSPFWQDNALFASKAKTNIFSSGGSPEETWSEENFSKNIDFSFWGNCATIKTPFAKLWGPSTQKNVDFSLWGKRSIVLPKWTFFHVLAHCAALRFNFQILQLECLCSSLHLQVPMYVGSTYIIEFYCTVRKIVGEFLRKNDKILNTYLQSTRL